MAKVTPKRGWKRLYADLVKCWNTGYGIGLGRFGGMANLFFTVASFFLLKQVDLSYTEIAVIAVLVIIGLVILGYVYLKMNLQKAEFSSNFLEQPELHEQYLRIQRIEEMLKNMQPKEMTQEEKEFREMFR